MCQIEATDKFHRSALIKAVKEDTVLAFDQTYADNWSDVPLVSLRQSARHKGFETQLAYVTEQVQQRTTRKFPHFFFIIF